jgi:glycosyltransferase involved in cell wall biosynthesis
MHVALVHRDLHQLTRGGICTVYRNLAERLASRGVQVTMITQDTLHPVQLPGVSVRSLPRTDDLSTHRRAVTELLTAIEPDVVECSTWEAELLTYLQLDRNRRAPVLVRGEFSAATLSASDLARDELDLVRLADDVVAVSAFAARDLATAYGISTPKVILNGIDRSRFHPGPVRPPTSGYRITLDGSGRPVTRTALRGLFDAGAPLPPWKSDPSGRKHLLWVGKITPMKGWDRLESTIRALRDIATVTVLLGHSPAYSALTIDTDRDVTVLQDLEDDDLPGLYRAADWLLSTSRWEGFGLAIAEAIACGTPALLPEGLGTAAELLEADGGATYRDPADIAAHLANGPPRPVRLPDHFDWHVNADDTMATYRDLIAAGQPCASC